jgi:hypothetical protein
MKYKIVSEFTDDTVKYYIADSDNPNFILKNLCLSKSCPCFRIVQLKYGLAAHRAKDTSYCLEHNPKLYWECDGK